LFLKVPEITKILLFLLMISSYTCAAGRDVYIMYDSLPLSSGINCTASLTEVHPSICPGSVYKLPDGSDASNAGIYSFLLKDVNGCDSTVKIYLGFNNDPGFTLGIDQVLCRGQSLVLNGPVVNVVSYLWNNGSDQPQVAAIDSGWYWLEVKDSDGCSFRDSMHVSMPGLSFSIGPDQILCEGDSVTLFGSIISSYHWSTGSQNPRLIVKTAGTYWAQVDIEGCRVSDTVLVTVKDRPVITAASSNDIYCAGAVAQLMAKGGARYEWSPAADLDNAYVANPVAHTRTTQTYTVKGTDLFGCSGYDSVQVKVTAAGTQKNIQMANAFTPNGDGKNDCFGIKNPATVLLEEFSIYNRFGQQVFNTRNAYDCWDGRFGGKMQNSDGYTFVIRVKSSSCTSKDQKGAVLLIR